MAVKVTKATAPKLTIPKVKAPSMKVPGVPKVASPMSGYTNASKGMKSAVQKYSQKLNAY